MSARMLVSYAACGCRLAALFDTQDPVGLFEFVEDVPAGGHIEVVEDGKVSAQPCPRHRS